MGHDVSGERFVEESERTPHPILHEGLGEAAAEFLRVGGDLVAEFEVVLEAGSFVESPGRTDRPGLTADPLLLVSLRRPPFAGGVEILQPEADGVDLTVALGALGLLLVGGEAFAGGEELVFEAIQLRYVRRGRGRWFMQQLAKDPGTSFDWAGIPAVAAHGQDGGHAEQSAARRILG